MQGDFKAYDLIAIHAGRKAGVALPTVAAAGKLPREQRQELVAKVASTAKARKVRDGLFVDFERRLRDSGYSGDQVWEWFKSAYGPIARSSIYRARGALRAQESRISEVSEQARAYMKLADEGGAEGVFGAATRRAGQLYFQLLMELTGDDLEGLRARPEKIIQLVDSLGSLQRARAQTNLLNQKLAEMRRKFDEEIAAAQRRSGRRDKAITPEMLKRVRETVFGSAA